MQPTIGVELQIKKIQIDGFSGKLYIWDTTTDEHFRSNTRVYYRGASACVLVYDVTSRASFENIERFFEDVEAHCSPECVAVLVGNKTDLPGRAVSAEEGRALADRRKCVLFLETSAKDNQNVEQLFEETASAILQQKARAAQ